MSKWNDPDEAPELDAEWFANAEVRDGERLVRRGRPPLANPKQPVSIRLDADVVAWFRSRGAGWQRRMNDALRKAAGL